MRPHEIEKLLQGGGKQTSEEDAYRMGRKSLLLDTDRGSMSTIPASKTLNRKPNNQDGMRVRTQRYRGKYAQHTIYTHWHKYAQQYVLVHKIKKTKTAKAWLSLVSKVLASQA